MARFTQCRRIRSEGGGFALVVTMTLLAFLVLLLVSLAALTRVETQVAANMQIQERARQHALLALNVAIGQLQRYAGPDNRITAQGSLTGGGAAGGSAVENPWFTGVWNADTTDTAAMTWLVSGNEAAGAGSGAEAAIRVNPMTSLGRTDAQPEMALADTANAGRVRLVGPGTARMSALASAAIEHGAVVVPAVVIEGPAPGVAGSGGASGTAVIGRYAWWIGDEGVKASLALPDRAAEVAYAPWSTLMLRRRLRQQIGTGPSYVRDGAAVSGVATVRKEGFDSFDNVAGMKAVMDAKQLMLLPTAGGTVMAAEFVKDRYHDFTTTAQAVLANTLPSTHAQRGLLRDLSTKPAMLGAAFARYADYAAYMEQPGTTTAGAPAVPATHVITDADSARRRYVMQPFTSDAAPGLPEIAFSVAPVLANLIVQFQVRRISASNPGLQVRSRIYVTMWNPYSAALVPPANLRLEISGLPVVRVKDATLAADAPDMATEVAVDLQATSPLLVGGVVRVELPFSAAERFSASVSQNYGGAAELATWLPGRVYSWTTASGASAGTKLGFYNNAMGVTGWTHVTSGIAPPSSVDQALQVELPTVDATPLKVVVKLGNDTLATYSARYEADSVPRSNVSVTATPDYWCFGYAFRINQPRDYDLDRSWLTRADPRTAEVTQATATDMTALIPFNTRTATSSLPGNYSGTPATTDSGGASYVNGNLVHRVQGENERAMSSYNDVSLFELPRLPLLSLGELQHVQLKGRRPFSIGNSWGGTANAVYDRFFFSGLPAGGAVGGSSGASGTASALPDIGIGQPLPNWNLKPVGVVTTAALLAGNVEETSRHLLLAGGFNVNSTSVPAWRAVLSSVRFSAAEPFVAAEIINDKNNTASEAGTQAGSAVRTETFAADVSTGTARPAPVFMRFPQSAQEVFYWGDPTPSAGAGGNARKFATSAFRLGVRGYNAAAPFAGGSGSFTSVGGARTGTARQHVTADQIEVLAAQIVARLRTRAATAGPFRSMEAFLSETSVFGGRSLLEDAIDAAGMNAAEVKPVVMALAADHSGLSTLTLTQADLLSAVAPSLRTRSDTFTVRAYGEVINPVTARVEGRAWAEARVQRFPETASATDSVLQPGAAGNLFGRRFKIIHFRWLSFDDL